MAVRLRAIALAWAVLCGTGPCWATEPLNPPAAAKPHLVIILLDDMGYGDAGCFNPDSKIPTPHIDGLARAGMRFTDAHAPGPLCHMSRYGMLTGRYPFRTDVSAWRHKALIEADQVTTASLVQSHGYHTAMVGKWHLGFDEAGYDRPLPGGPVDRGFHQFFGIRASTDIPPYFYIRGDRAVQAPSQPIAANRSPDWSPIQGAFWRGGKVAPDLRLEEVLPRFTDEAIRIIKGHAEGLHGDSPFMLHLAYPSPHTPWLPGEESVGRSGAGLYGDFVTMVDAEIGRVLHALSAADMDQDTLLIFTSDNGPVWYRRDVDRFGHDSTGGWRGMKGDAWEAGHRMPFIVRWPQRVEPGSCSDQLVCFTDLLATFADVIGTPLPPDAGPDSYSFLPALVGRPPETAQVRSELVMQAGSVASMMVIRSGHWKLITGLGSGGFSPPSRIPPTADQSPGQLYDLAKDPGETTSVYEDFPEVVQQLSARLQEITSRGRHR